MWRILSILTCLLLAACGNSNPDIETVSYPVISISEAGHCDFDAKTYCTKTDIYPDGRFEITPRTKVSVRAPILVLKGKIPVESINAIMAKTDTLDWPEFLASLRPAGTVDPSQRATAIYTVVTDKATRQIDTATYGYDYRNEFFQLIGRLTSDVGYAIKDKSFRESFDPAPPTRRPTLFEGAMLVISYSGGCDWGGRCNALHVFEDGSFSSAPVTKSADPSADAPITGKISETLTQKWMALANEMNWSQFIASLRPGQSRAPTDGTDIGYSIQTSRQIINLSSAIYVFDQSIEFFKVTSEMEQEVWAAIQAQTSIE